MLRWKGLVCQAYLLNECFEHLGSRSVSAFTWEGDFFLRMHFHLLKPLVVLVGYNNSEHSSWLFKFVTHVPVNYTELEANSKKHGSFDASHLNVTILYYVRSMKKFSFYFYHYSEWCSVFFSQQHLSRLLLTVVSHIPFDYSVVSCFWLARPAKVFLAVSSLAPQVPLRVAFILLQARYVAFTGPGNPTCRMWCNLKLSVWDNWEYLPFSKVPLSHFIARRSSWRD